MFYRGLIVAPGVIRCKPTRWWRQSVASAAAPAQTRTSRRLRLVPSMGFQRIEGLSRRERLRCRAVYSSGARAGAWPRPDQVNLQWASTIGRKRGRAAPRTTRFFFFSAPACKPSYTNRRSSSSDRHTEDLARPGRFRRQPPGFRPHLLPAPTRNLDLTSQVDSQARAAPRTRSCRDGRAVHERSRG